MAQPWSRAGLRAWSAGDFARYRASYVADSDRRGRAAPANGNVSDERVSRRGIQVGVRELSVVALPDGRMLTSFMQDRAPAYRDTVNKQLVWVRGEQGWLMKARAQTEGAAQPRRLITRTPTITSAAPSSCAAPIDSSSSASQETS